MGDHIRFDGRIGRGTFWKYYLVVLAGYLVATFFWVGSIDTVTGDVSGGMLVVAVLIWLALLPINLSANVRRWHDLDKSGWWMLISLVPLVGALYAFVMTGFIAGDNAPNQYGSAPN